VLPFRLVRIALEAEGLRLRHKTRRIIVRVVLGYFALGLVFCAVGFLHVAAWFWLRQSLTGPSVALIFAGADLLLGLILAAIAFWDRPGLAEREALAVRRRALEDVMGSLTVSALVIQVIERLLARRRG
jgi:uncharacterized membrane protein